MNFIKWLLITLASIVICQSCADDSEIFRTIPESTDANSLQFLSTRSGSIANFETDWENLDEIKLLNGLNFKLPWNISAPSSVHLSIRNDVKKEDGWVLLKHSLWEETQIYDPLRGPHYIAFYNMVSGDIKIFIEQRKASSAHSTAIWRMYFSKPQGFINSLNEVSIPIGYKFNDTFIWETTNAPSNGASNIATGWNCFIIPDIAYDPTQPTDIGLLIDTKGYSETLVALSGYSKSEIEGKVFTIGSKNPLSGLSSKLETNVGNSAEIFMRKILGADDSKDKHFTRGIEDLITSGVGGLAKSAATQILGKFFGRFSKPTYSEQNIRLTMKTAIDIKGNLITQMGTGLTGFGIHLGKDSTGYELGAWNLTDNPTIYMHPVGVIKGSPYKPNQSPGSGAGEIDEAEYYFMASGRFKADIVFNPQLKPHLLRYSIDCKPVYYSTNYDSIIPQIPVSDYKITDYGSLGAELGNSSYNNFLNNNPPIYRQDSTLVIYADNLQGYSLYWQIWKKYGKNDGPLPLYKYMYAPDNMELNRGGQLKISCKYRYVKVIVTMETEFEGKRDTIVTSRTYKHKLDWDPVIMADYSGLSINGVQSMAEGDKSLRKIDNGYYDGLLRSVVN